MYFDPSLDKFNYENYKNFLLQTVFEKIAIYFKMLRQSEQQVRNVLIILNKIVDVFPPITSIARMMEDHLIDLEKSYHHFEDIIV